VDWTGNEDTELRLHRRYALLSSDATKYSNWEENTAVTISVTDGDSTFPRQLIQTYQTTWRHSLQYHTLFVHLKSHIVIHIYFLQRT